MYYGSLSGVPPFSIEFTKNPPESESGSAIRESYWALGGVLAALFALILFFALLPGRAAAFWPFTDANAQGTPVPVIHDPSIELLAAALNPDPNPTKGAGVVAVSEGSALVSEAGPQGTVADVNYVAPSTDQISLYVVRPGDTLGDIAQMFGVSVNTIVWANSLGSTRDIHPGQQLVILPVSGIEHTVVKGDTLASLAKKFHADANEIAEYNGLDASAPLTVDSDLIIPGGELAAPPKTSSSNKIALSNPYKGGSGAEIDGYYLNPVPGAILTQSIHGWNGVDLGIAKGTPIRAAASGVVIVAANNGGWNGGYGNYVVVTHPNGTQTLYAHMTRAIVSVGESVVQGQVIGYVGATGEATGPHLHFEVRGARNPFAFCPVGAVCEPK